MWQEFLTRVALESHRQSIELSLLIDASDPEHCNKDTRFFNTAHKSQYAALLEFEQNFLNQCSAQQGNCDTSQLIYICAEKQKRWLRNTDYMHSIKQDGESVFISLLKEIIWGLLSVLSIWEVKMIVFAANRP